MATWRGTAIGLGALGVMLLALEGVRARGGCRTTLARDVVWGLRSTLIRAGALR